MGFAPRHYFSSLVTARLLLYFSHSYYFFVAITPKEIHLHSKDENGIQPFPASGSPTAGFSLSLKCERRQQVAAYFIPTSFHKKNEHLKRCSFFWRKEWDSNPRCVAAYLISSQGRYDHFDTFP